ncbi:MAG: GAF domain-containing protein [Anaerolineae bacterium]
MNKPDSPITDSLTEETMAKQDRRTGDRLSRRKTAAVPASMQRRPTLGFLIDQLTSGYHNAIWQGVESLTRERDVNLLCFIGASLHSEPHPDYMANVLYDLIDKEHLDGLIIASGSLGTPVSQKELQAFCERYRPLPMASIAIPLDGIPSVLMDNDHGMRELMLHLMDVHGYRRIAFFHKQEGHPENDARYNAYVNVLAEHGIAVDPDLVVPDIHYNTPATGIELLFDERQLRPRIDVEALVANDDRTALQLLDILQARGLRIPDDVAVVGFDDIEDSRYVIPTLTTARQPLHEQGRRAAELVLAQLQGETVEPRISLRTRLMVRQSCGCLDAAVRQAESSLVDTSVESTSSFPKAMAAHRETLLSDMVEALVSAPLSDHTSVAAAARVTRLVDAFIAAMQEDDTAMASEAFLRALDALMRETMLEEGDVAAWQNAISALRAHALACAGDEVSRQRIEDLLQQARVLIGGAAQQAQARQRLQASQRESVLREIGQVFVSAAVLDDLLNAVLHGLPRLGIPGFYLSMYTDLLTPETAPSPSTVSQLVLAYDRLRGLEQRAKRRYPTRDLLPPELLPEDRRYSLVILPLHFREEHLGQALLEVGPHVGAIYDVLGTQLSSALQGVLVTERLAGRALQLQTAAEVSRAASAVLDPEDLIQQVVTLVRSRFNLYYAGLFLVEPDPAEPDVQWAVLKAGSGEAGKRMVEQGHRLQVGGTSMIGWCVANRQARIAQDVGLDVVRRPHPLLPDTRSELALPLISRGDVIGALTIQSTQEGAFSSEDIVVLQTLADQLANAIINARLYEALEFEQYLMNTLMDNIPDAIYFKDRESRFLRASRSQTDRFGLSDPADIIGTSDFDYFTEDHARPAYEDEQRIIRTGEPLLGLEERETWEDRPDTWVATTKMPMRDREGNIIGTFGISSDITERKNAEIELDAERNLLRTLIDNLPDYIYIKDRESRFLINNIAHLGLLGAITQEEVIGKTDLDFFPHELAEQYYADEQALMESGEILIDHEESVVDQTTGEQQWVSSTKVPLRDANGQITGFVGMTRDITERKHTEALMRRRDLQLQTVADVARVASEVLDVDTLLQRAVDLLHEQLDLYYAGLFLVDTMEAPAEFTSAAQRRWAVLRAGTGEAGAQMVARRHRLEVGGSSMIGQCVATGEARIALDVGAEAVRFENPLLPETRSELALPLKGRGGVIGALTIQSAEASAFGQEDITVLQALADQLANAIENIRLFDQTQSALRDLEMIQQQYVGETWSGRQASSLANDYEATRPGIAPLHDASALPEVQETLTRKGVVTLSGNTQDGDHAALVAPITQRNEVIGALGIQDEDQERQWTEDEIALVETIAERMGTVAETLRLLEETQRTAGRERLTRQITDQIRGAFTVDEAIQQAIRHLGDALEANMVARIDAGRASAASAPEERGK